MLMCKLAHRYNWHSLMPTNTLLNHNTRRAHRTGKENSNVPVTRDREPTTIQNITHSLWGKTKTRTCSLHRPLNIFRTPRGSYSFLFSREALRYCSFWSSLLVQLVASKLESIHGRTALSDDRGSRFCLKTYYRHQAASEHEYQSLPCWRTPLLLLLLLPLVKNDMLYSNSKLLNIFIKRGDGTEALKFLS